MPEPLPIGEDAIVRNQYPHMMPKDAAIWTLWLREGETEIKQVWYDLKVGSPIALPATASPAMLRLAEGTGAKRIDVVVQVQESLWITEIKPVGNHVALGQALSYTQLFAEKYGRIAPLIPTILCVAVDPDLDVFIRSQGVKILTVPYQPYPGEL